MSRSLLYFPLLRRHVAINTPSYPDISENACVCVCVTRLAFFLELVQVEFGQSKLLLLRRLSIVTLVLGLSFPRDFRTAQPNTIIISEQLKLSGPTWNCDWYNTLKWEQCAKLTPLSQSHWRSPRCILSWLSCLVLCSFQLRLLHPATQFDDKKNK